MTSSAILCPIGDKFRTLPTYQEDFHDEDKIHKMIYQKLGNTGLETSLLGLGGAALASCYGTVDEDEGIKTVIAAVKNGINYIDTAPYYGQGRSEKIIGKALQHIPRSAYYLATKVGRYGPDVSNMFDFSAEHTLKSVEDSLERLGVEFFDILQVHDLEFASNTDIIVNETLPALQKVKDCGKIKFIGITGYPLVKLKEVLEKSTVHIDAVLSYCRCTLFDDSLSHYIPYFKSKNVAIINAAAVGMGMLTNHGPPDWHPASRKLKSSCKYFAEYCKKKSIDISKLAIIHSLSQPGIDMHLVGMENMDLLRKNLSNIQFVLHGLSAEEELVKEEIISYFQKEKNETHWENVCVQKYWDQMKTLKL